MKKKPHEYCTYTNSSQYINVFQQNYKIIPSVENHLQIHHCLHHLRKASHLYFCLSFLMAELSEIPLKPCLSGDLLQELPQPAGFFPKLNKIKIFIYII